MTMNQYLHMAHGRLPYMPINISTWHNYYGLLPYAY